MNLKIKKRASGWLVIDEYGMRWQHENLKALLAFVAEWCDRRSDERRQFMAATSFLDPITNQDPRLD